jgi:hypothetical protein
MSSQAQQTAAQLAAQQAAARRLQAQEAPHEQDEDRKVRVLWGSVTFTGALSLAVAVGYIRVWLCVCVPSLVARRHQGGVGARWRHDVGCGMCVQRGGDD